MGQMWLDSSPVVVLVSPPQSVPPPTVIGEAEAVPENYSSYT